MAENAGTIYYTVEADVKPLVEAEQRANQSIDKMDKNLKRVDKASNEASFGLTKTASAVQTLGRQSDTAGRSVGALTKLLGGFLSLQGVAGLIQMAEAYNEMAERVQMATSSSEEFNTVQTRLLDTANKTYRSLAEAQEVYVRTSASLKAMGYDLDASLDVTDSLSFAFVKNATSVARASSATDAFSKVLNKGKVEADAWETILAAIPTVVDDVAAAAGRSATEIRQMGVSGELSARMLTEGLRKSLDDNKKAAEGMATTVRDAFTALKNNLSAMVGEANRASGSTAVLSKAVLLLADNLNTVVTALTILGAGALAKYIASLGLSVIASTRAALAAREKATATLAQALAEEKAAAAAAGHAAAQVRLGGSLAASTAAANAHRTASIALATAQKGVVGVGTSLVGLLGGPVGIIALLASAAASVVLFSDSSKGAVPSVDQLADAIDNLTQAQLDLRRVQVGDAIEKMAQAAREANQSVTGLTRDIEALTAAQARGANIGQEGLANANKTLIEQRVEAEKAGAELQRLYDLQAKLANQKPRERTESGGGTPAPQADPDVAKRLQAMRDELELAKLTGAARERLQAIQKLGANATAAERQEAEKLATQIYTLEQAQKKGTDSTKKSAEASKENQKVLDGLATTFMQLGVSAEELEVAKARASLNEFATPEEIANVENMARAIGQVTQAEQNRKLLAQADPIAGAQMDFQLQIDNLRKLNEAKLIEDARYLELKAQAEVAYDERMRVLQEENFRRQSEWNDLLMGSLDQLGSTAADTLIGIATGASSGEDAIKALAGAILKQGVNALIEMGIQYVKNLIMGKAAGTAATAAGVAMAGTLATAYAIPAALASLMSFGANAAPAQAAIATTVGLAQGMSLLGAGKLYGGQVDPSKMYRVNENGAPEIFNAANGQQYMMPNQRGEVVSNRDATGGMGGAGTMPAVTINLIEDRERGGEVSQNWDGETLTADVYVADIRSGGEMSQALESTYGLTRQGR